MSITLAHGMLIYILASVFYLLRTRTIGTPFNDSLTEEQKKIKRESANVRRNVFYLGLILSSALVYFVPPFTKC
jgi:predicted membrane channel-forming protein YqfA (hemolysin III family)|tara:strand:+ start:730 stop:951 length:222 start_codon:yes stop_codon:yes gene_type:complete